MISKRSTTVAPRAAQTSTWTINPVNPTTVRRRDFHGYPVHSGPKRRDGPLGPGNITTPIYPFQIWAGLNNPLVTAGIVNNDDLITSSNSIVTLPIYDPGPAEFTLNNQPVTIVGYLQAFIQNLNTGISNRHRPECLRLQRRSDCSPRHRNISRAHPPDYSAVAFDERAQPCIPASVSNNQL